MVANDSVQRGDVLLVQLGRTRGAEIRKPRPCVVVSPDDLNIDHPTLIVVPLTTGQHPYPFRVPCRFKGRPGYVLADQILSIDRARVLRKLGAIQRNTLDRTLQVLQMIFAA